MQAITDSERQVIILPWNAVPSKVTRVEYFRKAASS
jgi:hypothetical protein